MQTLGRHLIAEYYGCERDCLCSRQGIRSAMWAAAEHIGATVLGESFHQFDPVGVSGTLVISESHLSVHTWPDNGYVAVDIYTCGRIDPRPGFLLLWPRLHARTGRVQEVLRGLPDVFTSRNQLSSADVQVTTRWSVLDDYAAAERWVSSPLCSAEGGSSGF